MDVAKAGVALRGIEVNVRTDGKPLMQISQSVSVVQKCARTTQSLYKQLAIAPG
jgi:hypothetical protein